MSQQIFAYARISTQKEKQKTDRQVLALKNYAKQNNFKFDEIIEEKISGTVAAENRPKYSMLRNKLRLGDTLVITDIDRLGRDANSTIIEIKALKKLGVRLVALDVPHMNEWDKVQNDSMYDMIIDILITLKTHMAQQEREKIVNRINQGLEVAKAKGVKLGRPKADVPKEFIIAYRKFKDGSYGKMSVVEFCKMQKISRSVFYKYKKILGEE